MLIDNGRQCILEIVDDLMIPHIFNFIITIFVMKNNLLLVLFAALIYCFITPPKVNAQAVTEVSNSAKSKGIFETDSVLELRISGPVRDLLSDRESASPYHNFNISYHDASGKEIMVAAEIKTRGHFRKMKENCAYPPLLLHFPNNDNSSDMLFKKNSKLKLGMPCRGDEYIIKEWLAYKLYNLITPKSFRARLVKVILDDERRKKTIAPFYGLLIEDIQEVAARNNVVSVNKKLRPEQTDTKSFLTMAVFEYLIGNTDWSVQYLQNIKLLASDSNAVPITVPYDFDMSAIVGTPYAKPAEELNLNSVYERRYRGYCISDMKKYEEVIELYNSLKKQMYDLYINCPLLQEAYIKSTIKFLDQFYATINNADALKKKFGYPCDPKGTGNIVIKGLRED